MNLHQNSQSSQSYLNVELMKIGSPAVKSHEFHGRTDLPELVSWKCITCKYLAQRFLAASEWFDARSNLQKA